MWYICYFRCSISGSVCTKASTVTLFISVVYIIKPEKTERQCFSMFFHATFTAEGYWACVFEWEISRCKWVQKQIHCIMVTFPSTPVCNSYLKNCVTNLWWRIAEPKVDETRTSLVWITTGQSLFLNINLQMIQLIVTPVLAAKDIPAIEPMKNMQFSFDTLHNHVPWGCFSP